MAEKIIVLALPVNDAIVEDAAALCSRLAQNADRYLTGKPWLWLADASPTTAQKLVGAMGPRALHELMPSVSGMGLDLKEPDPADLAQKVREAEDRAAAELGLTDEEIAELRGTQGGAITSDQVPQAGAKR